MYLQLTGFILLALVQHQAWGFLESNHKPILICHCDDLSSDVSEHCTNNKNDICRDSGTFGTFAETRKWFINGKWYITRSEATEGSCRTRWYETVYNPACVGSFTGRPPNGTLCYQCCATELRGEPYYCLNNPDANTVTYPTTTSTTTPTTTTITTTTTTTTTPTTTPTTTTTTTTTTPPPTTTISMKSQCEVCGISSGLNCTDPRHVACGDTEPFCMNTLISDGDNMTVSVRKTCATETECYYDSYLARTSSPHCATLSGAFDKKGACHYCCQSNSGDATACNINPIPDKLASFENHGSEGSRCEVGSNGNYQVQKCDNSSPMCMNTVIKSSNMTVIRKTCETKALCNTDWWILTRTQRPDCLVSNMTSLAVNGDGIVCHYCCSSKDAHACNVDDIPSDAITHYPSTNTTGDVVIG
ncbi:mucin-5AC-like [Mya arenaria]|uniref:mucin-5AC-like n=1 Tax=Mya arenaria TaxID=6604 RepID=UPI0022E582C4|nr:mucin-5AC-like [Mya arenaria]